MKRKGREVSWPFYSFLLSLMKEESLLPHFKTIIKELHNNMTEKMKIIGIIFSILMIINLQSIDPFYNHLSKSMKNIKKNLIILISIFFYMIFFYYQDIDIISLKEKNPIINTKKIVNEFGEIMLIGEMNGSKKENV